MSLFGQMIMYGQFALGLRRFLREPLTLEQSRQIIEQRLRAREKNLLNIARRGIYQNRSSPYLKLLKLAGCEYGDLEQMVAKDGIEPALQKLAGEGVYISIEEFKGKKELTRGANVFRFKESDFNNPFSSRHFAASSGATRSAGTRTVYDFNYMTEDLAVYIGLSFEVYDALATPVALWSPIMPGAGPLIALGSTKVGKTPVKWFSPVGQTSFRPSLKNRLGTNYMVYVGRLFGTRWPAPEYVALGDAWKVAEWLADVIKKQGECYFCAYASAAVRVCQAAKERGLNIAGTKFVAAGEPVTEAKRREVESAKAHIYPYYAFIEAGAIGYGCPSPVATDEVHFFKDKLALIQREKEVAHAATSVDAFLFTTLIPSAPKILLNVESGDYGVVGTRSCGCKYERIGFTDHIYNIRSFEKLTGEGMTFIGTDLVRIIEEVLPAKFGGASTDYQMVEEEDEQGHTHMSIIASPELGVIDETELVKTVLSAIAKGRDTERMMAEVWTQAGTLQVQRRQPFVTARGKLMPLHIHRHK
jgi:hypothetical protein